MTQDAPIELAIADPAISNILYDWKVAPYDPYLKKAVDAYGTEIIKEDRPGENGKATINYPKYPLVQQIPVIPPVPELACVDADPGLAFFTPSAVIFNGENIYDSCDGDYIIEAYCTGSNEPFSGEGVDYEMYLCEYGCIYDVQEGASEGFCSPAQRFCGYVSPEVKDKILELQSQGKNIQLSEGFPVNTKEYVVLSQNQNSRILELDEADYMGYAKFTDAISGETFSKPTGSRTGDLSIDGYSYHVCVHSFDKVTLTWGDGSIAQCSTYPIVDTVGSVGSGLTVSCPNNCISGTCM